MTSRREFLQRTTALGAALGVAPHAAAAMWRGVAPAPMRILILGGTGFIGPHIVRHAVSRGHTVSTFTRGRRTADLPDGVETLIGDRNGQLGSLEGKKWDAVIDDSASDPEWVRMSTTLLKPNVSSYLFTSSTGVFYPYAKRNLKESDPVRMEITDPKDGSESYGVRKAQCEKIVMDTFGSRGLVVRPTYIIGPGDTTDRFPYWPQRLRQGGETLAPGRKEDPVQLIDVRDLAQFMVRLIEESKTGIYNAAGPSEILTISGFLTTAVAALGSKSQLVWVDDYDLLAKHRIFGMVPWIMLREENTGHTSANNARAVAAGLQFRPVADTVRDSMAWWDAAPAERREKARFNPTPEVEAAVLAEWKTRKG